MKFKYYVLSQIADVIDSLHKTPKYTKVGYPMVRVTDMYNGYFTLPNNVKRVTEETYKEFSSKHKPSFGDIIMSRVGTYGLINYINSYEEFCIGQNTVVITNYDEKKIDKKFLYYFLSSSHTKNQIEKLVAGSTQKTISLKSIRSIKIPNISINEQKLISNILSSLDNKIENNNAIIANLEEQSQAIFKSWFVDFEPFQDDEFIESELSEIPKGWEVGKLGDSKLGQIKSSGIESFNGEKSYIATADVDGTMINNDQTIITYDDRPSRANMQPSLYSIWFAKMKESRKLILVNWNDEHMLNDKIFSTGFAGIQCNNLSIYYLWEFIKSEYFDNIKNQYSNGTTMQAINNRNINRILVKIPPKNVLLDYNLLMKPINDKISNLKKQNNELAKTRDTLLPKLMVGEIQVSEPLELE